MKKAIAIILVITTFLAFPVTANAKEKSRILELPNSYGTLKAYAWIQSISDTDESGEYKAVSSLNTKMGTTGNKLSVTCDFYIKGVSATVSVYVGAESNGPSVSANGGSWSKRSATSVRTPYGARVYGHGLWWYIGYVAYADLTAWGKNFQTSTKI